MNSAAIASQSSQTGAGVTSEPMAVLPSFTICVVAPAVFWLAVIQIIATIAFEPLSSLVLTVLVVAMLLVLVPIWASLCLGRTT